MDSLASVPRSMLTCPRHRDGVNDTVRVFGKPAIGTQANQFDHQDIDIGPTEHGDATIAVLPEDWMKQVRFSYADPSYYGDYDDDGNYTDREWNPINDYSLRSCGPVKITGNYWVWQKARAAYLLKAAVFSRIETDAQTLQDLPPKFWLYRYQDVEGAGADSPDPYPGYSGYRSWSYGTSGQILPRRMSHRYGPSTIGRIYRNRPEESETCGYNVFVNGLIGLDEDRYVMGELCYMEPPEPPDQPEVHPELGGTFDYGDAAGPYSDPTDPGNHIQTSSTHALDEDDTNQLPIGLLADTIYYRWSEPYRLDPRLLSSDPGTSADPELIARPASWALYDGRFDGAST